jgi:hypothetical protein
MSYMGVCYMGVRYMAVCYMGVRYMGLCYMGVRYMGVCYMGVRYMGVCYMGVCYMGVCYMGVCYSTNQEDYKKFDTNLATNFISTSKCITKTDANKLDEELQRNIKQYNTEDLIYVCFSCVTTACNSSM